MGATICTAVVPTMGEAARQLNDITPVIGDLEELEKYALKGGAELMICNSHGVESADRLGIPILRAGFPQYDLVGGFQRCWFGYRGTAHTLFDLANLRLTQHQDVKPYHSIYSQKRDGAVAPLTGAVNH